MLHYRSRREQYEEWFMDRVRDVLGALKVILVGFGVD